MVYKRYIYRNGKKFGPYYYESYRDKQGHTHSKYVDDPKEIRAVTNEPFSKRFPKNNKNVFHRYPTLFILLGVIIVLISGFIILGSYARQQGSASTSGSNYEGFSFKTLGDNIKSFVTGFTSETLSNSGTTSQETSGESISTGSGEASQPSTPSTETQPNTEPSPSTSETPSSGGTTAETPSNATTSTETPSETNNQSTSQNTNETQPSSSNETVQGNNKSQGINETAGNGNATAESNGTINSRENGGSAGGGVVSNVTNVTNGTVINNTSGNETIFNITNGTSGNFTFNITNETNITVLNETNITIINDTANVTLDTSVIQFGAVIGQPVRWEKRVKVDVQGANSTSNLVIDLPKDSGNISVTKISDNGEESVNANVLNEKKIQETSPVQNVSNVSENANPGSGGVSFLTRTFNFFLGFFRGGLTGRAVDSGNDNVSVNINDQINDNDEVVVQYYTDAPYAQEQDTGNGKKVKVVGSENVHYENVLTFTNISEGLNVSDPSRVKIYWEENSTYLPLLNINDTNGNGIYDYVEWIAPHLSNQTFDIIVITKAEHLDENKSFVSDIYNQTKALDGIWSEEIPSGHYVRVSFEKNLTNFNDITIYPRITSGNPRIEVYEENGNNSIAEFNPIVSNQYNKIYLTNLTREQATFDLRVLDGSLELDHIIDPITTLTVTSGNISADVDYIRAGRDSFQLKWSLSNIPAGVTINNVTVCVYEANAGPLNTNDGDVNVSRVNNQTWTETTINGGNYTSSTVMPITNISSTEVWNSSSAQAWWCTNVTDPVNFDYVSGNANTTVRLSDPDFIPSTGGTTSDTTILQWGQQVGLNNPIVFNSSEAASNTPQLIVVYTSNSPPQTTTNSTNSTSKGTYVNHRVYWTDDSALSGYIFSFDNGTGSYTNDSFVSMIGTGNWSNVSKSVNGTNKTLIQWRVYSNDSGNNWNVSSAAYYTSNDAPTQNTPIFSPTFPNNDQNFSCLNQSSSDANFDPIYNVYNWNVSGASILLLNMPFDTNSSVTAKDYSGYGNNGTLTVTSSSPAWNSSGRQGGAYTFSLNGAINITKTASLNNTFNFSVDFWINPLDNTSTRSIFTNSPDSSINAGEIFIQISSSGLTTTISNFTGSNIIRSTSNVFNTNTWQHIAVVETSGSGLKIYKNGVQIDSLSSSVIGQFLTRANDFYVGYQPSSPNSVYLNATLDNLRVWNRSLSANEVYQLYQDSVNGWTNSSGIVADETLSGENWTCLVIPNDAINDGTTIFNSSSIIGLPQWSSNSTNSTLTGSFVQHRVYWTDDSALSGYIFSFDNGTGTFTNDSFVSMIGTGNWSNVTKGVNTTLNTKIQWRVYSNDSGNNWNVTDTFNYNTSCGFLSQSATMTLNMSSAGTCFTIAANNVILDCAGYSIFYGTGSNNNVYGIESNGYNNTVIKNCVIMNSNSALTSSHGIYVHNNAHNNIISASNISTNGSSDYGIAISTISNNNSVSSSIINNSGSAGYGIYLLTNISNSNFTNNTVATTASAVFMDGTTTAVHDNNFVNSTFTNNSAFSVSSSTNAYQNIFLNTTFNKSKSPFYSCSSCNLTVQWYYVTNVTDQSLSAVQSANVTVLNSSGSQLDTQLTSSGGLTTSKVVTEFVQIGNASYSSSCTGSGSNITCATPHNVTANKTGYQTNSSNITIDSSKITNLILYTPSILAYVPVTDNFSIAEPNNQTFSITYTNTSNIYIKWYVNGTEQTSSQNSSQFIWVGNYSQQGSYEIKVNISNSVGSDTQVWIMAVNDTSTAPTHTTPIFSPTFPNNDQNFSCLNQSTTDAEGDPVYNIYNWLVNNVELMTLNMPFDINTSDTSTGAVKDYSDYGNNGTLAGSPSTPTWKLGKVGGAYDFDGVDDSMTIPNTASLNSSQQNMTISFWVNPKTPISGSRSYILYKGDGITTHDEYSIRISSSKILVILVNQTGSSTAQLISSQTISNDTYTFVAFSYNGTNMSLYLNGILDNTTTTITKLRISNRNITLGFDNSICVNCNTNMTLDELRIYNRTLSPSQVYSIYQDDVNGWTNASTISSAETNVYENWTCEVTPVDTTLTGITKSNTTNLSQAFSVAIDLSPLLAQQINWSLLSLPANNLSALGNNNSGISQYWVNVSVSGGTADLYMKASGNLTTSGGDVLGLGNETYSSNSTNSSVPSDLKTSLTTNYSDNKIGSALPSGNTLIYLKFFLNAPSGQPSGTYNNSLLFEAVQTGQSP